MRGFAITQQVTTLDDKGTESEVDVAENVEWETVKGKDDTEKGEIGDELDKVYNTSGMSTVHSTALSAQGLLTGDEINVKDEHGFGFPFCFGTQVRDIDGILHGQTHHRGDQNHVLLEISADAGDSVKARQETYF